jgi:threonine synthase
MRVRGLKCPRCGTKYAADQFTKPCPSCLPEVPVGPVVDYVDERFVRTSSQTADNSLWRYDATLPVSSAERISLGEGGTPLVAMHHLASKYDLPELYAKCEFANPTGSFKDRLASVAISSARALFGAKVIASSSTGNAGAAVAAYAAKAGMACVIFTTADAVGPLIAQMKAYGAVVVTVKTKADRWKLLNEGVERYGWFPTSPFFGPPVGSNPYGIEGYKSLAYELAEAFGWSCPDWVVLPICYGDALFGMARGFEELRAAGLTSTIPRLVAAEIYGSLTAAFRANTDRVPLMEKPYDTAASSISAPQSTYQALSALRRTNGLPLMISESELLESASLLSAREGVYVEPAAAASLAAVIRLRADGTMKRSDRVVCLLTAGGLKNPSFQDAHATPAVVDEWGSVEPLVQKIRSSRGIDLTASARPQIIGKFDTKSRSAMRCET